MTVATVAVVGGSGKTGRAVRVALAERGAASYAVGRADWDNLPAALAAADRVHVIAPNLHPDEAAYVGDVLAAAAEAGIRRLAYHSVAAPYAPDMPHHLRKAAAEDRVRRSGADWTVLQPCAYVQNLLPGLMASPPAVRAAYSPDSRFGLVDLADVGAAAAAVLLDDGHVGASYELGGPALVSTADVAAAAAQLLGRPVRAERVSPAEWARTAGAGLDPRERDWLLRMFAYYDAHGLPAGPLPLAALLGRPPTPLAETLRRELGSPSAAADWQGLPARTPPGG